MFDLNSVVQMYNTPQNRKAVGNLLCDIIKTDKDVRATIFAMFIKTEDGKTFVKEHLKCKCDGCKDGDSYGE